MTSEPDKMTEPQEKVVSTENHDPEDKNAVQNNDSTETTHTNVTTPSSETHSEENVESSNNPEDQPQAEDESQVPAEESAKKTSDVKESEDSEADKKQQQQKKDNAKKTKKVTPPNLGNMDHWPTLEEAATQKPKPASPPPEVVPVEKSPQDDPNRRMQNNQRGRRRDAAGSRDRYRPRGGRGRGRGGYRRDNNYFTPPRGAPFPRAGAYYPKPVPVQVEPEVLKSMVKNQIEYYFSTDNLVKDIYLRNNMDEEGWVKLEFLAAFNRVRILTNDLDFLEEALAGSDVVEVQKRQIRKKVDPQFWTLKKQVGSAEQSPATPVQTQTEVPVSN